MSHVASQMTTAAYATFTIDPSNYRPLAVCPLRTDSLLIICHNSKVTHAKTQMLLLEYQIVNDSNNTGSLSLVQRGTAVKYSPFAQYNEDADAMPNINYDIEYNRTVAMWPLSAENEIAVQIGGRLVVMQLTLNTSSIAAETVRHVKLSDRMWCGCQLNKETMLVSKYNTCVRMNFSRCKCSNNLFSGVIVSHSGFHFKYHYHAKIRVLYHSV